MSYLAMSAATIDNDNTGETPINKKRNNHNKTQKFRQSSSDFNPEKVNSVLQSIHNNPPDDDDLGNYNYKGNFETSKHSESFKPLNPLFFPEKPLSMGVERTKVEGMSNIDAPQPADDDNLKLQELQSAFMNDAQVRDYYRKLVPNYNNKSNEHNKQYYSSSISPNIDDNSNSILINKLNYMINLLEEQQDQKIGNITEEVVLYSFLGIFIIFIVDSFTKVGKYVR